MVFSLARINVLFPKIHPNQNGKKLKNTALSSSGEYSEYSVADSRVAYFRNLNKTMVVRGVGKGDLGKPLPVEFSEQNIYWGKASDSTFVTITYGQTIGIAKQIEDSEGNKLVQSAGYNTWYSLPDFRNGFDNGTSGDVFPGIQLAEPIKEIKCSSTACGASNCG